MLYPVRCPVSLSRSGTWDAEIGSRVKGFCMKQVGTVTLRYMAIDEARRKQPEDSHFELHARPLDDSAVLSSPHPFLISCQPIDD